MKPENQIDPEHNEKRRILRLLGVVILIVGLVFTAIGIISFFIGMGGGGFPRYFWCSFVGLPMVWLGAVLCGVSFMGTVARFMAGESAPVAKDTFNYMAEETKDGVKTVATAVGEGLAVGTGAAKPAQVRCHKCNQLNDADSKFCRNCGAAMLKTKPCLACNELNDPDAKFCDHCGRAMV